MEGEDYGMKNKNKQKRFSDDQIRSLESMFESQTKLEPRVKMEIARELGLQPRQVAIWFQNRRARWKSKQIEEDYKVLKANYDNLHSQFQALKMERQSLHIELQDLSNMLEKGCSNTTDINEDHGYHGGDGVRKLRNEPIGCSNHGLKETEWDGYDKNRPKFEQQEEETSPTMKCEGYDSDGLQDKWSNVHSSGLLDDTSGNVCWWDYWN